MPNLTEINEQLKFMSQYLDPNDKTLMQSYYELHQEQLFEMNKKRNGIFFD